MLFWLNLKLLCVPADASPQVLKFVRLENQMKVPTDYEQAFQRADLTFQYQRVYDIENDTVTTLQPVPADLDILQLDFLGP